MLFFLFSVTVQSFVGVYLNHPAEGHSIRCQFIRSHSNVVRQADRHVHTYLYNGLCFTVHPCYPCLLFLATVSLDLLFFLLTPLHCASLLLPILSCYKSSSFSLSLILPVSPAPYSLPLLPSLTFSLCLPEWVAGVSCRCQALLGRQLCQWPDK